jgi:hypothetical protein
VTVTDDAGDPVDLTAASVEWVLQTYGGETILEKSVGDGIDLVEPTAGGLEISIETGETDGEGEPGGRTLYHECEVTDSEGRQDTVFVGEVEVFASRT